MLDVAIDTARRCDDEAATTGAERRLAEPLGREEVVAYMGFEPIVPTRLHPGGPGEMNDGIDIRQRLIEVCRREICDDVATATGGGLTGRQIRHDRGVLLVRRNDAAIEQHRLDPPCNQLALDGLTDEASRTGHQHSLDG